MNVILIFLKLFVIINVVYIEAWNSHQLSSSSCKDQGMKDGCWRTDVIVYNGCNYIVNATITCPPKSIKVELPGYGRTISAFVTPIKPINCYIE